MPTAKPTPLLARIWCWHGLVAGGSGWWSAQNRPNFVLGLAGGPSRNARPGDPCWGACLGGPAKNRREFVLGQWLGGPAGGAGGWLGSEVLFGGMAGPQGPGPRARGPGPSQNAVPCYRVRESPVDRQTTASGHGEEPGHIRGSGRIRIVGLHDLPFPASSSL